MRARQPIDKLLASADTDAELKLKLQTLMDARRFATEQLHLPNNNSYTSYVATGSQYVTWNVVAAEEFSVNAQTWCFPIAGCVNYRGYFDELDAQGYADMLAEKNFDVTVGGASAYSTLGWFDDPVLDTMLRGGDIRTVGTLFHELSHQLLYVKDDSNYNEAFATFVEQQGTRLWLRERGEDARVGRYNDYLARNNQFAELLKNTRTELQALYAKSLPEAEMRTAKQQAFAQMRERYSTLKISWDGYSGYDNWFARELNNARLVSVATYRRYVPAFAAMFLEADENLDAFYALAITIANLSDQQRSSRVAEYLAAS